MFLPKSATGLLISGSLLGKQVSRCSQMYSPDLDSDSSHRGEIFVLLPKSGVVLTYK